MGKKNLMDEIKQMEDKARESAIKSVQNTQKPATEDSKKIDIDSWYYLRSQVIPAHHMKEIIKADFAARGLSNKELPETFDKALESYGVKLK